MLGKKVVFVDGCPTKNEMLTHLLVGLCKNISLGWADNYMYVWVMRVRAHYF